MAETRQPPQREKLTTALLDKLLRTRPHKQSVIWDTKETGLHVLISRGPQHKRQATVTFRVAFYMIDDRSVPRYMKIGRYPDESFTRTEVNVDADQEAVMH